VKKHGKAKYLRVKHQTLRKIKLNNTTFVKTEGILWQQVWGKWLEIQAHLGMSFI